MELIKRVWRLERPEKVEEEREWSGLEPRSERVIVVKKNEYCEIKTNERSEFGEDGGRE